MMRFLNIYECPHCNIHWQDEWDCMCNDRCPECDTEYSPIESVDLVKDITTHDINVMSQKDTEATIKWWKDKYEREVKENAKLRISLSNLQAQLVLMRM